MKQNRRIFIRNLAGTGSALYFSLQGLSCNGNSNEKKEAKLDDKKREGKLGIALVGLGSYSEGQLAPALQETRNCYLAGIVTGTPAKAEKWKKQYSIPDANVYDYQGFDSLRDNADIDIVYVVLPNALHAEYVIRAAQAGKHVICEKPMATSVQDCDKMIEACKSNGTMLSIGYRLHFEPYNTEMMRLGSQKAYGELKKIIAYDGMADAQGWRLDKQLAGGGPLMDLGVYCVQACRYVTGLEPVAVTAKEIPKTNPGKFATIEEGIRFQLEFPGGITTECMASYSESANLLHADATQGWFELSPAYAYSGIKGKTSQGKMEFPSVNQQAAQMDDFAEAIIKKRPSPVPGEMGRQDVRILMAIYEAMQTGRRVVVG